MKKVFFPALLLLPISLFAQNWHASFHFGLANYQGDLQEKSFTFKQSRLVGGVGVRYDLSEHLIARTNVCFSNLRADDAKNKKASLKERNLNFETKLFEWELGAQYNIFSLNDKWWTPYVFAGGALFHIKPNTIDNTGNRVFLQPLSTEGQSFLPGRKNYRLTQFAIPFGIGAEYALNEDMRVGLELGYRKTFTDYIDDVSTRYADMNTLLTAKGQQAVDVAYRGNGPYPAGGTLRGNEKYKDAYYFIELTFTWRPFVDWYQRTSGIATFKKTKKIGCPGTRVKG
jgi:opacity protein-like surface antigen